MEHWTLLYAFETFLLRPSSDTTNLKWKSGKLEALRSSVVGAGLCLPSLHFTSWLHALSGVSATGCGSESVPSSSWKCFATICAKWSGSAHGELWGLLCGMAVHQTTMTTLYLARLYGDCSRWSRLQWQTQPYQRGTGIVLIYQLACSVAHLMSINQPHTSDLTELDIPHIPLIRHAGKRLDRHALIHWWATRVPV